MARFEFNSLYEFLPPMGTSVSFLHKGKKEFLIHRNVVIIEQAQVNKAFRMILRTLKGLR